MPGEVKITKSEEVKKFSESKPGEIKITKSEEMKKEICEELGFNF